MSLITDPDVHEARMMAKSVRRDCHKMKAFLRFKEVGAPDRRPRRSFFAWFEPDHHVVARTAPFFQRRFTDMDWVIATPKGSAIWNGKELKLSDAPQANPGIVDETDDLWRTYFRNIFNPARLKIKAMQAEMPRKYWKNMPEAELIPELISGAEVRVREMAQAMATQPPLLHHRIKEAQAMATPKANVLNEGLEGVRQAAETCTRCPLYCNATQTVFGEGPENAGTMLVGEQPGDQEDLTGRPFVGPAGKLLEGVLSDVGLKRDRLYVTNAVKHFKFEPRGKRRIHQKPNMSEIKACRWWLTQELELVRPKIVVAMGATALSSLVEKRYKLSDLRGEAMEREDGGQLFVTVHPSYLLRIPDQGKKREEMQRFRDDLAKIRALGERAP
ncbi:uracil-DNA glycosylase [Limoniibacter endophyticus]|uniref:Type-4 uracil-DNA glycosylase n=1 Tax=Limoniibacter endophyticus TaxID=1565040 RepID=A0A8J3DGE9_9HYPH|nr:uracil-DNA glycosylase [Limoniibacter endophyticus]